MWLPDGVLEVIAGHLPEHPRSWALAAAAGPGLRRAVAHARAGLRAELSAGRPWEEAAPALSQALIGLLRRNEPCTSEDARGAAALRLMAGGVPLQSTDRDCRNTPLIWAAVKRHDQMASALVWAGAKLDFWAERSVSGPTALIAAAGNGSIEILRTLIAAGATVDLGCREGRTALTAAATSGDGPVVRMLLRAGADPEARDRSGSTALMLACGAAGIAGGWRGERRAEAVEALLESGASVDRRDNRWDETALQCVARSGELKAAELLIRARASLKAAKQGRPALMIAAGAADCEMVSLLIEARAGLDAQSRAGETALSVAATSEPPGCSSGAWEDDSMERVVDRLLSARASVELRLDSTDSCAMQSGQTVLMQAAAAGRAPMVAKLVAAGAELNKTDRRGNTALMLSCAGSYQSSGQLEAAGVLIAAKALLDVARPDGRTVLMTAACQGHISVVKKLMAARAALDATDHAGETALSLAVANRHAVGPAMSEVLLRNEQNACIIC